MASNDLASIAAATAAKYGLVRTDRGPATGDARYQTDLDKTVGGVAGDPVVVIRATGVSATSAAAADTAALANLNFQRSNRYGFDSAAAGTSAPALPPNTTGGSSGPARAATAAVKHTKDST